MSSTPGMAVLHRREETEELDELSSTTAMAEGISISSGSDDDDDDDVEQPPVASSSSAQATPSSITPAANSEEYVGVIYVYVGSARVQILDVNIPLQTDKPLKNPAALEKFTKMIRVDVRKRIDWVKQRC